MADTKDFTGAVHEETVSALTNNYDLNEEQATKKADRWLNAIENDMWDAFDRFIEEKMEAK